MKYIYPVLLFSLLSASCAVRMNYLGSSYPPTEQVDVYVDASAIKRPYTVIGKAYPEYAGYAELVYTTEKLQEKVVEIARQKGANAVLFQDLLRDGTSIYSETKTDSVNKGVVTTTTGGITPTTTRERLIFFLRYDK